MFLNTISDSAISSPPIWMGLSQSGGQWHWIQGPSTSWIPWGEGEPNNGTTSCGCMWSTYMDDYACDANNMYICETHVNYPYVQFINEFPGQ